MTRVLGVLLAALLFTVPAVAQDCPSPTGYQPKFMATTAWQCRWKTLTDTKHPWVAILSGNAALTTRYNNLGRWQALEYQRTGNEAMAAAALKEWSQGGTAPRVLKAGDDIREMFSEWVLLRELLKPYLEKHGRLADIDASIKATAETVLKATRFVDSDQVIGSYMGLALTDAALGTTYLSRTVLDGVGGAAKPVGGLNATAGDLASLRNVIRFIFETWSKGGQLGESTMYNWGTLGHAFRGAEWISQAYGYDAFPEITAFKTQYFTALLYELTPNLKDSFQWGDNQYPNYLRSLDVDGLLPLVTDSPGVDPALQAAGRQLFDDVFAANGWTLRAGGDPLFARMFYAADPNLPRAPWKPLVGSLYVADGQGIVYRRSATSAAAYQFTGFTSKFLFDHYGAHCFGDVRVFVDGQWSFNHPLGYALEPRYCNIGVVVGRNPTYESAGLVAYGQKPGEVTYAAGIAAGHGSDIFTNYYQPPPIYLHEQGRDMMDLEDVLVIHDRFHVEDPRTQLMRDGKTLALTRYPTAVQTRMKGHELINTVFHAPVMPTVSADGKAFSWPLGAQTARVQQVLPEIAPKVLLMDERQMVCAQTGETRPLCMNGNITVGQTKFSAHLSPVSVTDNWYTAAYCVTTTSAICTPLSLGTMEGVKVSRQGQPDAYVLFSAVKGPKLTGTLNANGTAGRDPNKIQPVFAARQIASVPALNDVAIGSRIYLGDLAPTADTMVIDGVVRALGRTGGLAWAVVPAPDPEPEPPPIPPVSKAREKLNQLYELLNDLDALIP